MRRRIRGTFKAFRAILPVRPATDLATANVDAQQRRRFRIEGDGVDRAALARAVEQGVEDHNDGQRRHDYQQFLNEHADAQELHHILSITGK